MRELLRLKEADRERFAEIVETSIDVGSRQQFFVWTQSSVQTLVPHEILICGIEDGSRNGMGMHHFSASRYFRQEQFEVISNPLTGLIPRLMAVAHGSAEPVILCPFGSAKAADAELLELVTDNELKNLAAQLVAGTRGKIEAIYVFSRISVALDRRLSYVLELLLPHVHSAFLRVLATERRLASLNSQRSGRLITPRQEQILNLLKTGKTNSEIAAVLDCSPWTIKNHIQAILRRLDSNTRTHAIVRAISLGILPSD